MKRILLIATIPIIIATPLHAASWTERWTLNGIPISRLHAHPLKSAAGIALSLTAHCFGHHAMGAMTGHVIHQDGLREVYPSSMTDSEIAWFGRAGFVAQLMLGHLLNSLNVDDTLRTAYHMTTLIEVSTYPATYAHKDWGDMACINQQGDAQAELSIYTNWALFSVQGGIR